jgi:hypothetical protein
MHELEHGFAGVMDEYWAGDQYAGEWLNMTRQTDPKQVKWKNWYGVNQIGIYQHCCGGNSAQWYRPHQNCKMRYLGSPFCSVCIQATVEKIHSLTTPVESYFPLSNDITDTVYPLKFKLTLIAPTPNTLKRNWLLNDAAFKQNIDSVSINENNLLAGTNTLKAIIEDTTQFLRIDNHSKVHISTVLWLIKKGSTGVNKISSSSSQVIIELYPNPTTGNINIKLLGPPKGDIQVEIFDLQGKRQKIFSIHSNGVHSLDLHNLKRGIYLARIFIDNSLITAKKIIRE